MLDISRLWARIVGLGVAVTVMVTATQLLSLGLQTTPLLSRATIDTITGPVLGTPSPGVGIMVAVALVGAGALALAGSLWPHRGPAALTTRRRSGWTRVDRRSLALAVRRHLEAVDGTSRVEARVGRSGRIDVAVTTSDLSAGGPGAQVRAALDEMVERRHLPVRPGVITIRSR